MHFSRQLLLTATLTVLGTRLAAADAQPPVLRHDLPALLQKAGSEPAASAAPVMLGQRDRAYEQALRYEACADKVITPAKVLRWLKHQQGRSTGMPSPTEFRPIVNVHDSNVRIIAAISYSF